MHGYMINKESILYQSNAFTCALAPRDGSEEFKPTVQLKQDGEKGKFGKKNKH